MRDERPGIIDFLAKNMIADIVADSQFFYLEKLGQGNMFSEANNISKARLPALVDAGHPTHEVGQSRQGAGVGSG